MSEDQTALEILSHYKSLVWPVVDKYINVPDYPKQFRIPSKYQNLVDHQMEIINDYPTRKGKYLRPTILILTCLAMNGKIEEVLNTAAAMQISEEWILIHDDVEDDSEERRGQLTLHKKYSFGHAVNAGDALFAIQQKAITNNFGVLSPKIAKNIADEFFLIMSRTTIGQGVEISYIKDKIVEYSDEDWFFIADSKSSYYTVAGPIRLGAIIAGATENQLNDLAEFGKNLGRSFQIIDDILDITSNFKGLKNQKGNDVYEGKRTLILGHLLRTIKGENKKKVIEIILKNRSYKSATEVDWVIQQMHLYGSIDYSKKIALKFKQKAEIVLDNKLKFLYKEPYINELRTLMNFVLERDH